MYIYIAIHSDTAAYQGALRRGRTAGKKKKSAPRRGALKRLADVAKSYAVRIGKTHTTTYGVFGSVIAKTNNVSTPTRMYPHVKHMMSLLLLKLI